MTEDKKKTLGAFYTPQHTANYMVAMLRNINTNSKLLEPSGGDGVFVSEVLKQKKIGKNQINVWDLNAETKKNIEKLGIKNVIIKDSLLETSLTENLLNKKDFYTHIIGNPPYLNKQSAYIKENKHKLRIVYKEIGCNDTYSMFIYLGCKLLAEEGQLCFIVSDTFLTLGIHKKLRKFLLENYQIESITLCPSALFKEMGALVNTCIICIKNRKPDNLTFIKYNDCRENAIGNYKGKITRIGQLELLNYPDFVFNFNGGGEVLKQINKCKKLIDLLLGGLGMHTTDNKKYLGVIDYNGKIYADGGLPIIPVDRINGAEWRYYHKRGGKSKYFMPTEHCIKWDSSSVLKYKIPKTTDVEGNAQGIIISGISSELSARLATPGALWESNKAFCFFPKDPKSFPPEFFIGLLNSKLYNSIARLLNHTVSLQIRDIKKLPFFCFSDPDIKNISELSKNIIDNLRLDLNYDFSGVQEEIDKIVNKYSPN